MNARGLSRGFFSNLNSSILREFSASFLSHRKPSVTFSAVPRSKWPSRAIPIDGIEPEGFRAREDSVTGGCARACMRALARRSIRTRRPHDRCPHRLSGANEFRFLGVGEGETPRETLPARLSSAQAVYTCRHWERVNARVGHPTFTHVPSQLSWRIVSCVLSGRARFRLRNETRVCGRLRFSGKCKRKRIDIFDVISLSRFRTSASLPSFLTLESNEARNGLNFERIDRSMNSSSKTREEAFRFSRGRQTRREAVAPQGGFDGCQ